MWLSMGLIGKLVLLSLTVLVVWVVAASAILLRHSLAARQESQRLALVLAQAAGGPHRDEALETAAQAHGDLFEVAAARLAPALATGRTDTWRVQALCRGIEDASRRVAGTLAKRSRGLAMVGAIAPLVGFFGTVVGFLNGCRAVAAMGSVDARVLAAGLGEALVTTALGLLIAIVALVLYAVARALEQGYRLEVLGSCARFERAALATHA
jgi:biopolymer transport protein ExbB/TolQ